MAEKSLGSKTITVDRLDGAFNTHILNLVKGMLAAKGLNASLVEHSMLFGTHFSLSAADYNG